MLRAQVRTSGPASRRSFLGHINSEVLRCLCPGCPTPTRFAHLPLIANADFASTRALHNPTTPQIVTAVDLVLEDSGDYPNPLSRGSQTPVALAKVNSVQTVLGESAKSAPTTKARSECESFLQQPPQPRSLQAAASFSGCPLRIVVVNGE